VAKVTQVTKAIINLHGASYKMSAILCPILTKLHFPYSGVKKKLPLSYKIPHNICLAGAKLLYAGGWTFQTPSV